LEDRLEEVEAGGRGPVGQDPQAALERLELRRAVWDALRRLSPADSEILILREFQELSYAEIAGVLDVPPGTVMSRLHAARRRMRGLLEPQISPASGGTARATGNTDGRNGHD
ncbi:MAG TPA: sigma-70 family RNA polymerase sigma factor, partial [Thermoleophilia bacterium]|nr:sigma-70 family RNA polymerase sigma factor [Thermoleophilia bacterium]